MNNIAAIALQKRIELVLPTLNEFQSRRFLASEARAFGHGGASLASRISGVSRRTIVAGLKELDAPVSAGLGANRSRKSGAGRKSIGKSNPQILDVLASLVDAHTKGNPEKLLLWTNKSLRTLEKQLKSQGYQVCYRVVGEMLKELGYSLQASKKTLTLKPSHPERDMQFDYINKETQKSNLAGNPIISIDAKKKENIGNFKNNGKTYQQAKTPVEVLDHDFPIAELGKATPFGIYNLFNNQGFVNVGVSCDTAAFAVESIKRWWLSEGIKNYANASEIVITADCGGSNGNRNRLWKYELQKFANAISKKIRVLHYPPGTSKWNKIEHRLFSFISKNWQGVALISTAVIVSLIAATKTKKGLAVVCVLDENIYEKGQKITDKQLNTVNLTCDEFHGEWNYVVSPNLAI